MNDAHFGRILGFLGRAFAVVSDFEKCKNAL